MIADWRERKGMGDFAFLVVGAACVCVCVCGRGV